METNATHPARMSTQEKAVFGQTVDMARAVVGKAYNDVQPNGENAPAVVMPVTGFGHDLARVGLDVARLATVDEVTHAHTAHTFARFGFSLADMGLVALACNPYTPEPWAVGRGVVLTSHEDGHITAYWNGAHYFRTYANALAYYTKATAYPGTNTASNVWVNENLDANGRKGVY